MHIIFPKTKYPSRAITDHLGKDKVLDDRALEGIWDKGDKQFKIGS